MKVLIIDINCKSSSTGQIAYNTFSYIKNQIDNDSNTPNTAYLCYGRGQLYKEHGVVKFGFDWETILHAALTRITGYTGCFSFFSTIRLINQIKRVSPDIVHIHEMHAYFLNVKMLLRFLGKKQIKVVHTLHCEFTYTGKCGHSFECDKWKTKCSHCPHLHDYPSSFFFDHTGKMQNEKIRAFNNLDSAWITTPSDWLRRRAEESRLKCKRITTVYNGVNKIYSMQDKIDARRKLGIKDNCRMIVSVANNIIDRAGARILEIAKELPDVLFFLIGNGERPDSYPTNIITLGPVDDLILLAKYYNAADLYLLCSQKETFSMPCAEAICCGTAVVGYKCGAPEEIFSSPFGEFVPYGNTSELVRLITNRFTTGIERNKCAEYGKTHFSTDAMCEQFMNIYDEIIKQ